MKIGENIIKKRMFVYLDNATTTKTDPEVIKIMNIYSSKYYSLPTSDYGHSFGLKAKDALEKARATIAKKINANPEEIIFTSGFVESNNLAIKGVCLESKRKKHIITSKIEHGSVLKSFASLEPNFKTTYINVDKFGFVDLDELERSINKNTLLVSIQHANQEIGTIQDIKTIGEICGKNDVIFHMDASQSFTKVPIDVKKINVDLISLSSSLIHGPKGVGALYIRKGVKIKRLFDGGYEEFGLRPGIENIPSIVGFSKAVELANKGHVLYMRRLRDRLMRNLLKIEAAKLNGPVGEKRLCNNVNITFKYVEGESLLLHLDARGIIVTTGSACFSESLQPSHVILALGLEHKDAHGSIRFSLSRYNTMKEMDYVAKNTADVVEKLREISPLK